MGVVAELIAVGLAIVQWVLQPFSTIGDRAEPEEGSVDSSLVGLSLARDSRLEVIAGRAKSEEGDERLSKFAD